MAYTTNHSMLQQMREGKETSWQAFREFYKPLIARRGKDFRLSPLEIDTLVQDVMLACYQEHILDNYDKSKGRFRDYLRTVTSRNALRIIANRPKENLPIDDKQQNIPDDEENATLAWQEFLLEKALEELRETMDSLKFMAFEMHVIQGCDAKTVAERLGMTTNEVYLTRTRTIKAMRDIIARLESELD